MNDPARVLSRVKCLRDARPVRRLAGGPASDSWLLNSPQGRLVLRMDRPLAAALGLDRAFEWQVLAKAHRGGVGPEPIHLDAERGVLVTRYLTARPWRGRDLRDPERLVVLARLLRRVHRLPVAGDPFDSAMVARRYAEASRGTGLTRKVDEIARLQARLADNRAPCLRHGDPNAANLLGTEPPRLIDWEYASVGDPLFDLAVVVRYHGLDAQRAGILLAAWSGAKRREDVERLGLHGRVYDLLTELWQNVVDRFAPGRF